MRFEIKSDLVPKTRQYLIFKNYSIGSNMYSVATLKSMDDSNFEQTDTNGAVVLQLKQAVDDNNNLQQINADLMGKNANNQVIMSKLMAENAQNKMMISKLMAENAQNKIKGGN